MHSEGHQTPPIDTAMTLIFTKKVVVACIMLVGVALALGFHLANVEQPDVIHYYELLESAEAGGRSHGISFTGKQERRAVKKNVVFAEADGRRCLRLASDRSDLVFTFGLKDAEIVEHLQGVSCDMQEELLYQLPDGRFAQRQKNGRLLIAGEQETNPKAWINLDDADLIPIQSIRHVDADIATYYYKRDLFSAEHVSLTRFRAYDHLLRNEWLEVTPTMNGLARAVQFSMVGNDPSFKAYHLKMTLFSKEGLL